MTIQVPDGRRLRSERSREAIVAALLEVVREGDVRPSAAAVAERAGVTSRTVFNHFGDMESLMAAAAATQLTRVLDLLPNLEGPAPREDRIRSLTAQLAVLLEDTMHVRWAALTLVPTLASGPATRQAIDDARRLLRERVAGFLQPELATIGPVAGAALLDALDAVHDPLVWRLRRYQQGFDEERARTAMGETITALVDRALTTAGEGAPTT